MHTRCLWYQIRAHYIVYAVMYIIIAPINTHFTYMRCVYSYSVIFLLKILNLYWDSLLFRGGSSFLYGLTGNA